MAARPQPSAIQRSAGCGDPAAAITAAHVVHLLFQREAPATPPDIPVPRRSNVIRRANAASRCRNPATPGISHAISMFDKKAGTSRRSSGPSPTHLVGDPQVTAARVPRRGSVHAADPSHGTRPGPGLRRPVPGRGRSVADRA